jgi:hypothetical protein
MKLLLCPKCHDIIRLFSSTRWCQCKESWGRYELDGLRAVYSPNAIALGMDNFEVSQAVHVSRRTTRQGAVYSWFIIPEGANIRREGEATTQLPMSI